MKEEGTNRDKKDVTNVRHSSRGKDYGVHVADIYEEQNPELQNQKEESH